MNHTSLSIGLDIIKQQLHQKYKKIKQTVNNWNIKAYLQKDDKNISIDILNDDCLSHIFTFLRVKDRILIEKVCKRWRILSEQSWYTTRTLYFSPSQIDSTSGIDSTSEIDLPSFLDFSLNTHNNVKSPPFLNCVGYGSSYNRIFYQIIRSSPNLRNITILNHKSLIEYIVPYKKKFGRYHREDSSYETLYSCRLNKRFDLNKRFELNRRFERFKRCDKPVRKINNFVGPVYAVALQVDLSVLFGTCTNLESLSISESDNLFDKTCFYLPTQTLHTLILEKCSINSINFSTVLEKLKNLKHLEIKSCSGILKYNESIMKIINKYCRNLRVLKILFDEVSSTYQDMFSFTHLTNLQILKIWYRFYLSDTHIADIVLHCQQLTCIDILGSHCITDIGLTTIATLPKLEKLCIGLCPNITDYGLRNIRNLKEFGCVKCPLVTINGILTIILSSPQLQLLNIFMYPTIIDFDVIKRIFPRIILNCYFIWE